MSLKKNVAVWVLAGMMAAGSAAPACAAGEYELRARIDKLERDLQYMQRQPVGASSGGSVGEAKLSVRLSELEDTIRRMNGRAEENEYQIQQLKKELKLLSEDVGLRLQTLEQNTPMEGMGAAGAMPPAGTQTVAPAAPAITPVTPPVTGQRSMEQVVDEVSTTPPAVTPPATPVAPVPVMKFNSPQEHYSHAFTLINRAQYTEAEQVLRSFVQQYPKDPLAGNAYYWLGETYYVRDNFLSAADAFRQGFESMPAGSKAPDNLLKLGMSLGKLGKKDQSCVVLKQLQVKYSGKAEPVLQRAAKEQQALGCN